MWEKEKMLVTSIFSFYRNVSTLPKTISNFSVTFILSSANAFNLGQAENLSFGKELTLYFFTEQQIFEPDQTESICRWQWMGHKDLNW